MAAIGRTRASLRIYGDDLDPDAISVLLGVLPSSSTRKRQARVGRSGSKQTERIGRWQLAVARRRPGDLDNQLVELLSPLNPDTGVWRSLVARFSVDIFCGLFMEEWNEGFTLRPETLEMIASRGLSIGFDIYGPPSGEDSKQKGEP